MALPLPYSGSGVVAFLLPLFFGWCPFPPPPLSFRRLGLALSPSGGRLPSLLSAGWWFTPLGLGTCPPPFGQRRSSLIFLRVRRALSPFGWSPSIPQGERRKVAPPKGERGRQHHRKKDQTKKHDQKVRGGPAPPPKRKRVGPPLSFASLPFWAALLSRPSLVVLPSPPSFLVVLVSLPPSSRRW